MTDRSSVRSTLLKTSRSFTYSPLRTAMPSLKEDEASLRPSPASVDKPPLTTEVAIDTTAESAASGHISAFEESHTVHYRSFKRRWFGLVALMLLNFVSSWAWLTFAPISSIVADFFSLSSETPVNWLSTVILFTYLVGSVPSAITLNRYGVKVSMLTSAVLLIIGSWVRVAGVKCRDGRGSFGVLIFGQIIVGLGQPFSLNAPSYYSDMWFTSKSRVSANALASLSNPLGGAIGQLVSPAFVSQTNQFSNMVLWVSIIATILCLPAIFIPARPPCPPCPSSAVAKFPLKKSVRLLLTNRRFMIIFFVFAILVGFFNAFSSLINQIMEPYGYTSDQAGYAGAILIVAGLVFSAILSPILDRLHTFLLAIQIQVPIIAVCYICLIFTQTENKQLIGPYIVSGVLGASSFSLLPLALEWVQEQVFPVSPELTSSILWAGGNLVGGIFIVVMDALKYGSNQGSPPQNMKRSLIFEAVVAGVTIPLPFLLGNKNMTRNRRVELDEHESSSYSSEQTGEEG
ncbi:major facilitator superfamily domain-containing protein [Limtongia smithiae]|uniref:major facilitator superfamily domain-containing protein n=1 Tax=Limtongia smithiae TaxID=1125753 RepID=UPI0034CEAE44